ncbi:hypothetical protein BC831DRAFT_448713 [Entophlyctis helioformis]|nr:hypothetical protein BC831DRAFT_448713 [Entophlyctis helioformis]
MPTASAPRLTASDSVFIQPSPFAVMASPPTSTADVASGSSSIRQRLFSPNHGQTW